MSDLKSKTDVLADQLRAEFINASPERQLDLALDDLKWAIEEQGYQYRYNVVLTPALGRLGQLHVGRKCCLMGAVRLRRFGGNEGWGHFCAGMSSEDIVRMEEKMWAISYWAWINIEHEGERV